MNEMQQILKAIQNLEKGQNQIVARLGNLEEGQQATNQEVKSINTRLDTMQSDIASIKATVERIDENLDSRVGATTEDIRYLQHKISNLEQATEKLRRDSFTRTNTTAK